MKPNKIIGRWAGSHIVSKLSLPARTPAFKKKGGTGKDKTNPQPDCQQLNEL